MQLTSDGTALVQLIHLVYHSFIVATNGTALVQLIIRCLQDETLELLGELMLQSHSSYSRCGLGAEGV